MFLSRSVQIVLGVFFSLPLAAQVTFKSTTYPAPSGVYQNVSVAADIDRDGNPDLIVADGNNPQLLIYYGTGGGTLGSPDVVTNPLNSEAMDIAVGDFNGDGKLDILVACSAKNVIDLLINNGDRTFTLRTLNVPDVPYYLAVGDFNNDGKLDFAVEAINSSTGANIHVYNGAGDGTFTPAAQMQVAGGSYHLIAADLNRDGKIDLVNVSQPTTIFLNSGSGTFVAAQNLSNASGLPYQYGALGDLNADAVPDLLLSTPGFCGPGCGWKGNLDSYLNDGTGHFTLKQSVNLQGADANFGLLPNLNYDSKLDMLFSSSNELEYALGNGNGTFQSIHQYGTLNAQYTDVPSWLLTHDFNNDGLMDVASAGQNSTEILLNTSVKPDCPPPNSKAVGSTLCSLVSGQKVNSTFAVRAAANGPVDIRRMEEWLDGKKVYQALSNQLRNNLTTTAGSHMLTIATVDVLNNVSKKSISFSTISCSAPSSAGVRVCTPTSGSTVSSPLSVVAASTPSSGTSVTAVRLYVDGVSKYTTTGSRMSTSVSLSRGTHHLSVVAYEKNGGELKSSETITVQ